MSRKQPSTFSIAVADTAALGHVNSGLNLYRTFEALSNEKRQPGEQLDFSRLIEAVVPAVTNLALGLELLLKVHHFQISGEYPRGHDIAELGRFPDDAMNTIRANYKEIHDNRKVSKGLEFRLSGGVRGAESKPWASSDTSTFDLAIAYIGPMYVKWRYIYEEFQEETDIRIYFAPLYFAAMAVHKAIRGHRGGAKITLND